MAETIHINPAVFSDAGSVMPDMSQRPESRELAALLERIKRALNEHGEVRLVDPARAAMVKGLEIARRYAPAPRGGAHALYK